MARVLIVDDSAFARVSISRQLGADPEIEIIGVARNGIEALEQLRALKPDVVTLDVEMPRMGGLQTLAHIMAEQPTPVVMLSSLTGAGTATTIRALELGAIDYFLKSSPAAPVGANGQGNDLVTKVKVASRVRGDRLRSVPRRPTTQRGAKKPAYRRFSSQDKMVVIGSSTGGPGALYDLVPRLPVSIPASVLLVQHMPAGFTKSLAERLNELSPMEVKEAENGDKVQTGQVLLAPGNYHMTVTPDGVVRLNQESPVLGLRPAVDVTMQSVASVYGASSIGVVLTGMGTDGTKGAAVIRGAGGRVAAQDEASSIVYGMPRSVAESGNVDRVVSLRRMASEIVSMCREH